MDKNGWVDIDILLAQVNHPKHNFTGVSLTYDTLMEIVETNDKKRFTVSEDGKRIRAAQGHSTKQVEIQHRVATPPDILYHGTAEKSVQSIFGQGLHAGSRHFVHLSADIETAIKVGSRHGKPVVLTIDTAAMLADGRQFLPCRQRRVADGKHSAEVLLPKIIYNNSGVLCVYTDKRMHKIK